MFRHVFSQTASTQEILQSRERLSSSCRLSEPAQMNQSEAQTYTSTSMTVLSEIRCSDKQKYKQTSGLTHVC